MQAVLLVEVYSIFKSRRPPLQLSKNFENVYRMLALDPKALTPGSAHDTPLQEDLSDSAFPEPVAQCKQRLLLSCYILDSQHATLFGRQRTTCLSDQGLSGINLPFVRSQPYWDWDASLDDQAQLRFQQMPSPALWPYQVFQAMEDLPTMGEPSGSPHGAFQSSLMLACMTDPNTDLTSLGWTADDETQTSSVLPAVEQSLRMRLAYHTFKLCYHTPTRDLLAVAGESWVMAEKLGSQSEYTASQIDTARWAGAESSAGFALAQAPVQRALHHALKILDIHRQQPQTGLLFQEWSIYLAAVVIWEHSYVTSTENKRRLSLAIPSPVEPRVSMPGLEAKVVALIEAGETATLGWNDVRTVLLWVKQKIEKVDMPHNCGLTNGALDVLGKLVTRGNEEGWFGS